MKSGYLRLPVWAFGGMDGLILEGTGVFRPIFRFVWLRGQRIIQII